MRLLAVPLMLIAGSVMAQEARPVAPVAPTGQPGKSERIGNQNVTSYGTVRVWKPDRAVSSGKTIVHVPVPSSNDSPGHDGTAVVDTPR